MSFTCKRCGAGQPQLEKKPLGGKLGAEVLANICGNCWSEWDAMQIKIINEYRLNLAVPQHFDMLVDEMKNFLRLKEGATGQASVGVDEISKKTY